MGKQFRFTRDEYEKIVRDIHSGKTYSVSAAISRELIEVATLKDAYPWRG